MHFEQSLLGIIRVFEANEAKALGLFFEVSHNHDTDNWPKSVELCSEVVLSEMLLGEVFDVQVVELALSSGALVLLLSLVEGHLQGLVWVLVLLGPVHFLDGSLRVLLFLELHVAVALARVLLAKRNFATDNVPELLE